MIKRGQSLIELLIAMTVIIVGLSAVGTMIFSNMRLQERSTDRLIASNLAREGVELAKAVRDSNWVEGGATAFDEGLRTGNDITAVPHFAGNGTFINFSFIPDVLDDEEAIIYRSDDPLSIGLFTQGPTASGAVSLYRRLLTFSPICADFTTRSTGNGCNPMAKIGIR